MNQSYAENQNLTAQITTLKNDYRAFCQSAMKFQNESNFKIANLTNQIQILNFIIETLKQQNQSIDSNPCMPLNNDSKKEIWQ